MTTPRDLSAALVLLLSACASAPPPSAAGPYEGCTRAAGEFDCRGGATHCLSSAIYTTGQQSESGPALCTDLCNAPDDVCTANGTAHTRCVLAPGVPQGYCLQTCESGEGACPAWTSCTTVQGLRVCLPG